jgi:hypothetical protein
MTTGMSFALSSSINDGLAPVKVVWVFEDVIIMDTGVGDVMWEAVTELGGSRPVGVCPFVSPACVSA